MSVVISWMVSLPVGIISASRSNSVSDHVARAVSMVFLAIPGFWLAMLIMLALLCWFNYKALLRYAPAYIAPVSGALFGPSDHVFGGNNQYRGDPGFLGNRHSPADSDLGKHVGRFVNFAGATLVAGVFPWAGHYG